MKVFYAIMAMLFTALSASAQVMVISPGTHAVNTGGLVLESTSLVNNGTFTNANTGFVVFKGSGDRFIQGNGSTSFYAVGINKTGNLLLQTNIKVAGNLTFASGSLDLGSNSVQLLYPNGFLQSETEQSRIFSSGNGVVFIEQPLNAPNNANPGNLGFKIWSANDLGTTLIYRGHDRQAKNGGDKSISRYYNVVPGNNAGVYAYIQLQYLDGDLNGLPEGGFQLHEKAGAADWQPVSVNGFNSQDNWVEVIGLPSLQKYTLFPSVAAPLPLQLLAFDVRCKDGNALLQWITANEVNTKQFLVEKSSDGLNWATAQTVAAHGNAAQQTYSTLATGNGASFYRLKMEDKDGRHTYSPVRKMVCDGQGLIAIGPNPTNGPLTVSFRLPKKDNGTIQLWDANGRLLQSRAFAAAQGLSAETLTLSGYGAGTYLVTVNSVGGLQQTAHILKR